MLWCYLCSYAQQTVDKGGQSAVDKPGRGRLVVAGDPPGWPQFGAVVAVLNTYKKNFLKKFCTS